MKSIFVFLKFPQNEFIFLHIRNLVLKKEIELLRKKNESMKIDLEIKKIPYDLLKNVTYNFPHDICKKLKEEKVEKDEPVKEKNSKRGKFEKISTLRKTKKLLEDEIKDIRKENEILKYYLENLDTMFDRSRYDASYRDSGRTSSSPI
jgi:hypothetical protein